MLKLAPNLALPPDAVTQTFALLAKRGAGKSNAAAVLAEEFFAAGLPFVAIDPVRSWYGLRSSRDGKKPGLPIPIFGGLHGDVPLERTGGNLIADLIAEERLSCVLDVSEMSKGDRARFLIDFAERLYRRNTEPLHLFLEEADDYCPQKVGKTEGERARLLGAFDDIVRRGRAKGLGITMITQRSAVLNKDCLTQVETLIALRTVAPQDRDAIGAWVKYHGQAEEILGSLAGLKDGEAWVWSPHWLGKTTRVQFRQRSTFDSGATPKHMSGKRASATLADVDLGALKVRMADTLERAKAEDPRELRRRIAELERQVAAKPAATPAKPVDREKLIAVQRLCAEQARLLAGVLDNDMFALKVAPKLPPVTPKSQAHDLVRQTIKRQVHGLSGPEQRVLDAIAWWNAIGIEEPEQVPVAHFADYTPTGGSWANTRGALRTKGLVEYIGSRLKLTPDGKALANAPNQPPTTEALHARVLERLSGPEQRMLRALLDVYPNAMSNEELAAASGYEPSGGSFANTRGHLRSLGLIDYPARGTVVARSLLFL